MTLRSLCWQISGNGGKVTESWQAVRQKIESALANPRRDAFISGMLLRIAPLADGGVLLSGDYHPGVVAVARRMRGVFLGKSSSWRVNATAEILRVISSSPTGVMRSCTDGERTPSPDSTGETGSKEGVGASVTH